VGGHCIGVDPYYLTHKAQEIGYHPEMILAGRRLNDNMAIYVAGEVVKLLTNRRMHVKGSRILVLGLAFKENCPDLRNSKVIDLIRELGKFGAKVDVFDPWIYAREARHEYGVKPLVRLGRVRYDATVVAVGHREFKEMGVSAIRKLMKPSGVVYDIKHVFPRKSVDGRL
jgi:UDP-N-acetyl-D-galactosamine dehydrogenase